MLALEVLSNQLPLYKDEKQLILKTSYLSSLWIISENKKMHVFKFDFWEVLNVLNFMFKYKIKKISICKLDRQIVKNFCILYFFPKNSEVLKIISMKM